MALKSISGFVCYVKDLDKTISFYEKLGFQFKLKEPTQARMYLNWFWADFLAISKETKSEFLEEAKAEPKGAGIYLYASVEDVDETYKELVGKGIKPSSEPRDWPWGNREFVVRDPDGYKLVFFAKSKPAKK